MSAVSTKLQYSCISEILIVILVPVVQLNEQYELCFIDKIIVNKLLNFLLIIKLSRFFITPQYNNNKNKK